MAKIIFILVLHTHSPIENTTIGHDDGDWEQQKKQHPKCAKWTSGIPWLLHGARVCDCVCNFIVELIYLRLHVRHRSTFNCWLWYWLLHQKHISISTFSPFFELHFSNKNQKYLKIITHALCNLFAQSTWFFKSKSHFHKTAVSLKISHFHSAEWWYSWVDLFSSSLCFSRSRGPQTWKYSACGWNYEKKRNFIGWHQSQQRVTILWKSLTNIFSTNDSIFALLRPFLHISFHMNIKAQFIHFFSLFNFYEFFPVFEF